MTTNSIPTAQIEVLNSIHHVSGFNPAAFLVEFTDLTSGETRKRLPVMVQIAWFRLVYPEGKIALSAEQRQDYFVATARIYPSYQDPADQFLAEATASRGFDPAKPSVSPREWAQTAAVGIALRNAGFGVQFNAAGDEFPSQVPDEFAPELSSSQTDSDGHGLPDPEPAPAPAPVPVELTPEQQYQKDIEVVIPDTRFKGMTLGELLRREPNAVNWFAMKYKNDPAVQAAAKRICDYALHQETA